MDQKHVEYAWNSMIVVTALGCRCQGKEMGTGQMNCKYWIHLKYIGIMLPKSPKKRSQI